MWGGNPIPSNLGVGELQLGEDGWLEDGHCYFVTSHTTSGASKFCGLRVDYT